MKFALTTGMALPVSSDKWKAPFYSPAKKAHFHMNGDAHLGTFDLVTELEMAYYFPSDNLDLPSHPQ